MKKYDKPDTLAVIDNYNFYERQTDRHRDPKEIKSWGSKGLLEKRKL